MNRSFRAGLGAFMVLVGLVWALQGLGYLTGSVMTGVTLWAVIGPIVAILGAIVLAGAVRTHRG